MITRDASGLAIGGLAHCPLGCHDRALVEALVVPIGLLLLEIGAGTRSDNVVAHTLGTWALNSHCFICFLLSFS
ncbi:hypothetical protein V6N12_066778 [Hibiscus sabdariffa]|uniref:Uncharacterized protein n=1 Tax=Hibiscus sabdariffa TaxID=183260 RepID=A0ABR2CAQ5_9ROSI